MLETTLLPVMLGLTAGGTAFSAISAREQGEAENEGYKFNAMQLIEQSKAKTEQGHEEADLIRERARELLATQIATAGAGGGGIGGSTLVVMGDSALKAEKDAQKVMYNSQVEARGLKNQALLQLSYGDAAVKAGNMRALATTIQGASNILLLYSSYGGNGTGFGKGGSPGGTGAASKRWNANNNFGSGLNRNFGR